MHDQDELKRRVARAAIEYVPRDGVIGVGTGSTANYLIDMLGDIRHDIKGAVASSIETERRLKEVGIDVLDLNMTGDLAVYIDGADEANNNLQLIKGGGGALTREKIVAGASREFICIVDHTKRVDILGTFPLPVEVIPMARSFVARQLVKLGGDPELREDTRTDNNNLIIDIHNLDISQPIALEQEINQIPGVVTAGLFAVRSADILLTALEDGDIETIRA